MSDRTKRQMKGESLTAYLQRRYDLGQLWGYNAGCVCEGCTAWRRTLKRRKKKK